MAGAVRILSTVQTEKWRHGSRTNVRLKASPLRGILGGMKHQNSNATAPSPSPLFKTAIKTATVGAAALLLACVEAGATTYQGNGSAGFSGAVGEGTLTITDDGTNISGSLTLGNGQTSLGGNGLVLYIDTGAGNGFNTTLGFDDQSHQNQITISGVSAQGRSVMNFMSGFAPQYAISLIPGDFGGLYGLTNGGNSSMPFDGSVNLSANPPYTFTFPATSIGLTPLTKTSIKIFGTFISGSGYRSTECIAGNDSGTQGWNTFTQTAYGVIFSTADRPSTRQSPSKSI